MNDLEKLIWNHDRTGAATSFLLSKEELQEFINAAIAVGQEGMQGKIDIAYENGASDARLLNECEYCDY